MKKIESEDINMLKSLNAHKNAAFESIFHTYYPTLCFFANRFLNDQETARDIVQEIFIRFWEKDIQFENFAALKSFLYTCVQNQALNHIEKQNIRNRINKNIILDEYHEEDYFQYQVEAELLERINNAIEELPTECKRIFKLSYIDRLSVKEICEHLGVAESTVKTQRQRAKKALKERLQNSYRILFGLLHYLLSDAIH